MHLISSYRIRKHPAGAAPIYRRFKKPLSASDFFYRAHFRDQQSRSILEILKQPEADGGVVSTTSMTSHWQMAAGRP